MNERFKCIFFNILFCLFGITFCFFFKIDSYAVDYNEVITTSFNGEIEIVTTFYLPTNYRFCFLNYDNYGNRSWVLYGNYKNNISVHQLWYSTQFGNGERDYTYTYGYNSDSPRNTYFYQDSSGSTYGNNGIINRGYIPQFSNIEHVYNYLADGSMPPLDYDDSLNLDSMIVTSWNVGNNLGYHYDFRYKVNTTWSNPAIANVKVRVKGTRKTDDFLGNISPYSFKIHGYDYANVNGDVVEIIATPYNSNGAYGNSLYSSFVYDNLHPLTYIWRKLFKTNDYDNTIEIPYTDPSGNDIDITLPVDGVTNNYTYNIKYNPQTEEITNQYLVDNYYNLVVDYPEDLSGNETIINETQNYLNQYYTTNNYYQTTKDVDVDFDFDFGDISSNDAQGFKTQFDGFFDGLGNFIGKLAKLLVGLAPWLSPAVAVWIVAGFGFLVALLVLLLVIKLVSFVRSLLPF